MGARALVLARLAWNAFGVCRLGVTLEWTIESNCVVKVCGSSAREACGTASLSVVYSVRGGSVGADSALLHGPNFSYVPLAYSDLSQALISCLARHSVFQFASPPIQRAICIRRLFSFALRFESWSNRLSIVFVCSA